MADFGIIFQLNISEFDNYSVSFFVLTNQRHNKPILIVCTRFMHNFNSSFKFISLTGIRIKKKDKNANNFFDRIFI